MSSGCESCPVGTRSSLLSGLRSLTALTFMLNPWKRRSLVLLMASASLLGGGAYRWLSAPPSAVDLQTTLAANISDRDANPETTFDPLAFTSPDRRKTLLREKAEGKQSTRERSRARYLLASLYLRDRDPNAALTLLAGLEADYPALADGIWRSRAEALQAAGNPTAAREQWERLLQQAPDSPAAADALFALGRRDEIPTRYPSHPRSRQVWLEALRRHPNDFAALSGMATYFNDDPQIVPLLNRLTAGFANRLTSDQWWAIAEGYWDKREYGKAALAYARATPNARNVYRLGRSLHISGKKPEATLAYNRVVAQYPDSPEAPRALLRLMAISAPQEAVRIADRIASRYPDTAGEALLLKADILEKDLKSAQAASATRSQLLSQYASTAAAAELAVRLAKQQAKRGDLRGAIALTQRVLDASPHVEAAAEAAYWQGKWATRRGDRAGAQRAFTFALQRHPQSYFAWRSASALGWHVGDFQTARTIEYAIQPPSLRRQLPAGSAAVKELHLLGLDREASERWQFETRGRRTLTPAEVFTDGVLRVGINDNLNGIFQLDSLSWIDVPANERAEIERLQRTPTYWYTLYPFPYWELIGAWAQRRNLSPAMVMALVRQESRFEAQILSRSGAVGLMQVMPATGQWIASKIGRQRYSLKHPPDNVEFGTWYLDYTHQRYGNNSMLAIASYNAGPGSVGRWLQARGLGDPDEFVDAIPFDETRDYVKKVFGNYWNYLRLYSPDVQQRLAQLGTPALVSDRP